MLRDVRLLFQEQAFTVAYRDHRAVPQFAMRKYLDEILSNVDSGTANLQILDVVSGPGSFAIAFAKRLPFAEVKGVDASPTMTAIATDLATKAGIPNIEFRNLHVDSEKIEGTFDVIVCSEMVHLVERPRQFLRILSASLRPGGVIAIRTSSQEQILRRHWYTYFPAARIADLERHKSTQLLVAICEDMGLKTVGREIDESRKIPTRDYLAKFSTRSFSTLHLILDEEYEDGMKLMHKDVDGLPEVLFDYRTSLLMASDLTPPGWPVRREASERSNSSAVL
jgi:2-polyprenyl-3-methyl-5-hydroxy-6-metoxy-1,4-benzoquinol methylase